VPESDPSCACKKSRERGEESCAWIGAVGTQTPQPLCSFPISMPCSSSRKGERLEESAKLLNASFASQRCLMPFSWQN